MRYYEYALQWLEIQATYTAMRGAPVGSTSKTSPASVDTNDGGIGNLWEVNNNVR